MKELIPDKVFKLMNLIMKIMEGIHPYAEKRARSFGIKEGMTIVDYGCGPGRYTIPIAKLAGKGGKIFAVDINKIAFEEIEKKIKKEKLTNIQFNLAKGYNSNINSEIADMVIALDMFFMIEKPEDFLKEVYRILKKDGLLVIDDGHQSRKKTLKKIMDSGIWEIVEERKDCLICMKA